MLTVIKYQGAEKKHKFNQELFNTNDTNSIHLAIKNFNLKNGLSKRIFDPKSKTHKYSITGPLGKGLGITSKSTGTHFVFAAGIGVLAFIDLIARMILQQLDQLPKGSEKLQDDFHLVFYVSFPSKEGAVCLKLLDSLAKICKKKGIPEKFQLVLRFSNLNMPRWDKTFVFNNLMHYTKVAKTVVDHDFGIKKIWVAGPPLMSE